MSSLNLQPNLAVIVVQTGLFFVNFVVLKKLLINPYLEVRERRRTATTGNMDAAASLIEANKSSQKAISDRMHRTYEEIKQQRDGFKTTAQNERDSLLKAADQEAKQVVQDSQHSIRKALEEERAKVPNIVESLSEQLFKKVLN